MKIAIKNISQSLCDLFSRKHRTNQMTCQKNVYHLDTTSWKVLTAACTIRVISRLLLFCAFSQFSDESNDMQEWVQEKSSRCQYFVGQTWTRSMNQSVFNDIDERENKAWEEGGYFGVHGHTKNKSVEALKSGGTCGCVPITQRLDRCVTDIKRETGTGIDDVSTKMRDCAPKLRRMDDHIEVCRTVRRVAQCIPLWNFNRVVIGVVCCDNPIYSIVLYENFEQKKQETKNCWVDQKLMYHVTEFDDVVFNV